MRKYTRPTAIALGVFDGVHLGHRAVLNAVYELYRNHSRNPGIFTFMTEDMISKKITEIIFTEKKIIILYYTQ